MSATPSRSTSPRHARNPSELIVGGLAVPFADHVHGLDERLREIPGRGQQRAKTRIRCERDEVGVALDLRHVELRVAFALPSHSNAASVSCFSAYAMPML